MTITFAPFDPAEYLKSDEAILAFPLKLFQVAIHSILPMQSESRLKPKA